MKVWATHTSSGFHAWVGAKGERAYLGSRHRHLFRTTVWIDVLHEDREIEFHDLRDEVAEVMQDRRDFGPRSCESIAQEVMAAILKRWPDRRCSVEVSEDGECGAIVYDSNDEV